MSNKANQQNAIFLGSATLNGANIATVDNLLWNSLSIRSGFKGPGYYCLDGLGYIRMRGYVLAGTSAPVPPNAVFAYLPAGYKPSRLITTPVSTLTSDVVSNYDMGTLVIKTDGSITLGKPLFNSAYTGGGVSLDGVSFLLNA